MMLWAAPRGVFRVMVMVLLATAPVALGQQFQQRPGSAPGGGAGMQPATAAGDSVAQPDVNAYADANPLRDADSTTPMNGSMKLTDAATEGFSYDADPNSTSFADGSLFPNFGSEGMNFDERFTIVKWLQDDQLAPPPPPADHPAQDGTLPNTGFPVWQIQSNRNIDPRIRPNMGLRVPLLAPLYSPVAPDFNDGVEVTKNWSVRVSLAVFDVNKTVNSSKFNEYRDIGDGGVAGIEAHYRQGQTYFNLVGRNIGRNDQDINWDGGVAGKYLVDFTFDDTPHNYMFGARSLYTGVGTDMLTISPLIRSDLQNNSTSVADATAKLAEYDNTQSQNIDEGLKRTKVGGDFTLMTTYPWVFKLGVSNESRDGERPWSGSFGFGDFVEIPWPVKYDTHELKITAEYAKPESRVYFITGYRFSDYEDHYLSLTFDNPLRITDSANLGGTYNAGPAEGRLALYPSNQYHEVFAQTVIRDLPWESNLSGYFSGGFMRQDAALIPFSTNSSDILVEPGKGPAPATDPDLLPRNTAKGSMDTQAAQVRWTAHPSEHWRLVTEYRLYKIENYEPPFVIDEFVREDQDIRTPATPGGTFANVDLAYTKHDASAELDYDFSGNSRIGASYSYERWNRRFREVAWMNDNVAKVFYDTRYKPWLDLKAWYQRSYRDTAPYYSSQYDADQGNALERPQLPYLHKFDETPYTKDDAQAMATFTIKDSMSVSAHALFGGTRYTDQTFGLLNDKHYEFGADYSYSSSQYFAFFASYNWEKFHSHLRDRTWFPGAPSDPYSVNPGLFSYSNWDGYPKDVMQSAGIGFEWWILPRRVSLNFQYTFENTNGYQSYDSPLGPAAVDENDFIPTNYNDVDGLRYQTVNPEFNFVLGKALQLAIGYDLEQYHINDYNYYGFKYVDNYNEFNITSFEGGPPGGIALLMGGLLPPSYTANVFYFRFRMGL